MKKDLRVQASLGGGGGTQKKIMYNFLDSFLSEVFHNDVIASALLR